VIRSVTVVTVLAVLMCRLPLAAAATFHTVEKDPKNNVQFTSATTMEKFTGRTSTVNGSADIDPANLAGTISGSFAVDMASLSTGMALRDQHMRENQLETAKYPQATFTLKRFEQPSKAALASGEEVTVTAVGDLMIHGASKEYSIPLKLRYLAAGSDAQQRLPGTTGNVLYVSANWTVKLEDHKIPRPEFLFMRLAPEQKIELNVAMTDQ
jgi:polyisoprenoid-binding protein YceI